MIKFKNPILTFANFEFYTVIFHFDIYILNFLP